MQDLVAKTLGGRVKGFSAYGAVGSNQAPTWVPTREILPTATLVVRRPPTGMRTTKSVNRGNCTQVRCLSNALERAAPCGRSRNAGSVPLPARQDTAVQGIVIHSTNGGNSEGALNGALG